MEINLNFHTKNRRTLQDYAGLVHLPLILMETYLLAITMAIYHELSEYP